MTKREPLRLAVVRDYRAEGWPSMDLCADQLLAHLPPEIAAQEVAPAFVRLFSYLPLAARIRLNGDRLLNRYLLLPGVVRRVARRVDFVHIVDHSYAHLVEVVGPGRAGVYCHDLDAFRCLLAPAEEPRPVWFRRLARRLLRGLQQAAVVFYNSRYTAEQLTAAGLVPAERLVHAPLGVAMEFTPVALGSIPLPVSTEGPYLLHVGSNIPRKRLDVLLEVYAAVRQRMPAVRLIQVGGPWPPNLRELLERLNIVAGVTQVRGLSRAQLAELYRKAKAVLVPSASEGFGLPVIEALACGTPVVASDIPSLREAGGAAVLYCPVGDVAAWTETVLQLLRDPCVVPPREIRLRQAAAFSWARHARIIADTYLHLTR
ncbi:MAG: glycosyltransferase [Thermogemmata sp.]|nr:glycosyltransferase [Thermogemmata sp.]